MTATLRFLKPLSIVLLLMGPLCSGLSAQTDSVYYGSPAARDTVRKKSFWDNDWKEKLTYGGNFQLQFGTYTFVYVSPTIGFIPFEDFNIGIGVIYNYISINYGGPYGRVSQSIFGGHSYARYFVTDGIFIQGQYDRLRQPDVYSIKPNAKTWVEYVLVGGGFKQPIGDRAALSTSIMYNLTPSDLSIYPSRLIIQFGFMGTF